MSNKTNEELQAIVDLAEEARREIERRYTAGYEACHRKQLMAMAEYRARAIATGSCWIFGKGTPHEHDGAEINTARHSQERSKP